MDRLPEGRPKRYVEVLATHRIDGSVRPQQITLAAEGTYPIEEVKSVRPCKDLITHEYAKEYTIVVHGQVTQLYEDDGRWWVKMKERRKKHE